MSRVSIDAEVRRKQLLDIGFDLYLKHGMDGFSIKDVVSEADVAIGLFYYYFKSKDDFLNELLNEFINSSVKLIVGAMEVSHKTNTVDRILSILDVLYMINEKLAPYKSSPSYTVQHYIQLELKLLTTMQPIVESVIDEGVKMGIFHVERSDLVSRYITYGISGISSAEVTTLDDETKAVMLELLLHTLQYTPLKD